MARRHVHDDHINHEAWAIPYGDLVTLLLAFFVVMYAISSVNEGKYRAVSDSLNSAFGGPPRSPTPVQLGRTQLRGAAYDRPSLTTAGAAGPSRAVPVPSPQVRPTIIDAAAAKVAREQSQRQLQAIGERIGDALSGLVDQKLVRVRRGADYLEVEIQSDLLFSSGSAAPSAVAIDTIRELGGVLRGEPNAVRIEGYTDDQPIRTPQFPSNWELSAARAASVLHELEATGIAPARLSMVGFGQHQPVADNGTAQGRNANRRVMLVILAAPQGADSVTRAMPVAAEELPSAREAG
ncbi:flagellar motor protein MotD [Lysobacter humi (ex Lee et al. 2017)]